MDSVSNRGLFRNRNLSSIVFALMLIGVLLLAAGARAAETIYWDNYGGPTEGDTVSFSDITGSGGGLLNLGAAKLDSPEGMAYDTVTNRLFVASETGVSGQIIAINLDGSGATPFTAPGALIEEPEGIAVDPAARMIYWANDEGAGSIAWAKLDGSAGGVLNTTGTSVNVPCCRIAVDPTGGRVYWINTGANPNTINFANLNNTGGGGELNLTGSTIEPGGEGLALDSAAGHLYFLGGTNEIGYANLNGSGGGDVAIGSGVINGPWGLALDPSIGRLYWGNESNGEVRANAIGFVNLAGAGGGISPVTAPVNGPQDPVVIKDPTGVGAPTITRSKKSRSLLTCSTGSWGADFPGGFVYQAPRSFAFQWLRNSKAISGATASTLNAKSAGKYACTVTATNQIGSASQTSAKVNVKAAKVKLTTKRKAQAEAGQVIAFKVKATNTGDIKSKKAKVCVKLSKAAKADLKAPQCKSLGKLKGRGKKAVTLKIGVDSSAGGTYQVTFVVRGASGKSAKSKIIVG